MLTEVRRLSASSGRMCSNPRRELYARDPGTFSSAMWAISRFCTMRLAISGGWTSGLSVIKETLGAALGDLLWSAWYLWYRKWC